MSSIFGLLLALLLLALVLNVVAYTLRVAVAADSCQRRPWLPTHWREPIEEGETVRFEAEDGTSLEGTFLHRLSETSRGTVVYSHELNGDRWNALPYVEHLRADGFDVFTFDYRVHGRSQSQCRWDRAFEVTKADLADLRAAIHAAASKSPDATAKVGVIGVGKGAAVALCAAPDEPAIRGLVLDSIQPLPGAMTERLARSRMSWWRRLLRGIVHRPSRDTFDPDHVAPNVRIPVLLIHGRNDVYVPLESVRTLASRITGQCQLWIVPGARHAEAIGVDRISYWRRTSRFLIQSMQTKPAAAREKPQQASPVMHHGQVSSMPAH
ncbi:MAG: alpha/beta hydrolase [Thermoguttaceae bacterium]